MALSPTTLGTRQVLSALLPFLVSFNAVLAQQLNNNAIERVESGLQPPIAITDEPVRQMHIRERMARYSVPAVSLTVFDQHRIVWSRAYGYIREDKTPATTETIFQAASISKPVTAAATLILVARGVLDLDVPLNKYLSAWKIPESPLTSAHPVTLRRLLSHSAAISVHGFDGYDATRPVPTTQQVLDGAPPANSLPIRVDQEPGKAWRYSGGGYLIVQQLLEDVTHEAFSRVMSEMLLQKIGMKASSFVQPLPDERAEMAATGYHADGRPLAGRWRTYPEQAAAGLWTTPSDLARFALWVMSDDTNGGALREDRVAARLLLARQPGLVTRYGGMGLGFFVGGERKTRHFLHGGGNAGFRCYLIGFPATGQGVAIMTNSDSGIPLALEITRSVAREYRWPDQFQQIITVRRVDPVKLGAHAGVYRPTPTSGTAISISVAPAGLEARLGNDPPVLLRPESENKFVDPESGTEYLFSRAAANEGETLLIKPQRGNTTIVRREPVPRH